EPPFNLDSLVFLSLLSLCLSCALSLVACSFFLKSLLLLRCLLHWINTLLRVPLILLFHLEHLELCWRCIHRRPTIVGFIYVGCFSHRIQFNRSNFFILDKYLSDLGLI